ncbi:hypothetical protein [Novipirellula maiorica]|uniref:hypothetical protein n=1 Tax=Novipirellula maiorica TaxID=1265734 RepID=UPI0009D94CAB|nr:hypothetical protein [Rhodopirellula maiorica]
MKSSFLCPASTGLNIFLSHIFLPVLSAGWLLNGIYLEATYFGAPILPDIRSKEGNRRLRQENECGRNMSEPEETGNWHQYNTSHPISNERLKTIKLDQVRVSRNKHGLRLVTGNSGRRRKLGFAT